MKTNRTKSNKKSVAIAIDANASRNLRGAVEAVSESANALMTVTDEARPSRR
jgi:threonine synthase